ncbi:AMP-binding protein [Micromonospora sp. RTGN7]|uniref:AMP-binding protein n=1 Tax=Micromonospora sp. RTGN7 TaxID=3016526 RepID=UPI0029FEE929|nr:AMP-binding protein [Micromonospora sp. RTGN7]
MADQGYAAGARTIAELLRSRAQHDPDRRGYTFLADGDDERLELTYGAADVRARAVAAALRAGGARPGDRAVLLLPPGLDYVNAFFGCLYAGVIAVPVYPPDPFQLERTLPRLLGILRDAGPVVALTVSPVLGLLDELTRLAPELDALRWVAVDEVPDDAAGDGPPPVDPDATAMLQYTSGSTAQPKGVMLSHRNLLHNSGVIQRLFGTTPDSVGASWLPPYHDMGLIGGLLQPLYAGCPVVLMSPLHFLQEPARWLRAVDRFRVTVTGGPDFAYDLCARKAGPELLATVDLSSWRVAFNGAEPVRPGTLRRFAGTFGPSGFRAEAFLPCYGLAEATLIVSGAGGVSGGPRTELTVDRTALSLHRAEPPMDGVPPVTLTGCGRGAPDQRIAVVDPVTAAVCDADRVGEIWVSGPSVAGGYWHQPAETAEVFRARLAGEPDGPTFLRTGDLGFLRDGELVVTGRLKDLIIVRGRNHYPQDIEHTATRAHPVLRPGGAAAFLSGPEGSDQDLVVVLEVRRGTTDADVDEVASHVREAVATEHGLQVHTVVLVRSGGMPKTSSGKVQRRLCRARFEAAELPEAGRSRPAPAADGGPAAPDGRQVLSAPADRRTAVLEDYLRAQVTAVSGIGPGDLDRDRPLTAAGLDSLAVLQLKQRVEADLGLTMSLTPLLTGASLAELTATVSGQLTGESPAAPAAADRPAEDIPTGEQVVPVSDGQRWIWFSQQFEPGSSAYNVSVALRSLGPVDGTALRRALDALVARHAVLRTTFPVRDDEPVMLISPDGRAAHRDHDTGGLTDDAVLRLVADAARTPFDLESGPLLRTALYRRPGGDILLLSMHHIVTDFWSMTVLARDLGEYYTAYAQGRDVTPAPPRATYVDVVSAQRRVLDDPVRGTELARYWDGQVGDGVSTLSIPGDGDGGARFFTLSAELSRRLHERAAAERVTPYMLLLAAFQVLLHHRTGATDLAIGTSVAARGRPEFADVVGCCMNPVLIRGVVTDGATFRDLLHRTRERVAGAVEHQDYPMALLARRHRTRRRGGSLYDVLFTFNRSPEHADELAALAAVGPAGMPGSLGTLRVENVPLPQGAGALPLELMMAQVGPGLHGLLRYRDLDEPSAALLVEDFVAVLEAVAGDPGRPVGELAPRTAANTHG